MNTLYFACPACRAYVDAGYRHAYWELEHTGIVSRSSAVDTSAILRAEHYWNVDADWLVQLLPAVRRFLEQHAEHDVRFGDSEDIPIPLVTDGLFDWVMEAGFALEELPRYYVERLGFRTWDEVTEHIQSKKVPPGWWEVEEERMAAHRKFMDLLRPLDDQSAKSRGKSVGN
jgi:hypothetical protein